MKKLWGLVILAALIGIIIPLAQQLHQSQEAFTPDNLIRIHVVANSDSTEDQAVKLRVKDSLVSWLSPKLAKCDTAAESRRILAQNLDVIEKVAGDELRSDGKVYSARAFLGEFEFPTRQYDGLILPAGSYQALRVVLGDGQGQNWWCVLYPPLCVKSASAEVKNRSAEWFVKNKVAKAKRKTAKNRTAQKKKK